MLELLNIVGIDVNMKTMIDVNMKTLDKVVEIYWKLLALRKDIKDHGKEEFVHEEVNDDINGGDILNAHEIYHVLFTWTEV